MWKRPIINTGVQIVGKALMIGVGLITTRILTRRLGVETYGSYTLILAVFIFLDSIADFGTRIIGVREMSRDENKKEVWNQFFWLRLMMTGISTLVALAMIVWWPGFSNLRMEVGLATMMMWMTSMAGSLEIIWQTEMKMEKKVIVEMMYPLLFLFGLFLFGQRINLIWVFGAYLIVRAMTLIAGWWWANKNIVLKWPKLNKIKEYWKMSWPMGVYLLVFTSYDRAVDSLMIQGMLGIKELAWYGLAYKIYSTLLQPAYFLVSSVFPIFAQKETNKRKLFWESGMMLGAGSLVVMILIWWMTPLIINVLGGNGFEPSILILRILLIALVFSYFGHLVGFTLIAQDKQKIMLKLGLINLFFNLTMNWIMIPRFGIMGAAGVTVVTEAVSLMVMWWGLKRKF